MEEEKYMAEFPVWVLGEEVKDGQCPRDKTQRKSAMRGPCCNPTPCPRTAVCLLVFQRHVWICLMGTVVEIPMTWFWMSL